MMLIPLGTDFGIGLPPTFMVGLVSSACSLLLQVLYDPCRSLDLTCLPSSDVEMGGGSPPGGKAQVSRRGGGG